MYVEGGFSKSTHISSWNFTTYLRIPKIHPPKYYFKEKFLTNFEVLYPWNRSPYHGSCYNYTVEK